MTPSSVLAVGRKTFSTGVVRDRVAGGHIGVPWPRARRGSQGAAAQDRDRPGGQARGEGAQIAGGRAAGSGEARGARQRLVPYHAPAIALPSPYSPSSGPAAALSPCWAAKAMVARSTATNSAPRQTVIPIRIRRPGLRSADP